MLGMGGEHRVAAYLEVPAITNKAPCKTIRYKNSPSAGTGTSGNPWAKIRSSPCYLQLCPKPDLLLIWFQARSLGLLRDVQKVPVAVSGHDSVPCGTA